MIADFGTDDRGEHIGKVYYIGGAGFFGNVGTRSVPAGLRAGGWEGAVKVVGWQSTIGGAIRDQMDSARNHKEANLLRQHIVNYIDTYPGRPVHIVALSAGTGIAVWAVEELPEPYRIDHLVLLSSSLSSNYDLSRTLSNMNGELWNIYSPNDEILRLAVPLSGSVDRQFSFTNYAGVAGIKPPSNASPALREEYTSRVLNLPWEQEFINYGYYGRHAEPIKKRFIQHVVTPLMLRQPLSELLFSDYSTDSRPEPESWTDRDYFNKEPLEPANPINRESNHKMQ